MSPLVGVIDVTAGRYPHPRLDGWTSNVCTKDSDADLKVNEKGMIDGLRRSILLPGFERNVVGKPTIGIST